MRCAGLARCCGGLEEAVDCVSDGGEVQLFLGRVVEVEASLAGAGCCGDALDAGVAGAEAPESLRRDATRG